MVTIFCWLVVSTQSKNMIVKLDHFLKVRGDNKKGLKPPSSFFICWWVYEFHHYFRVVRVFSSSKRKHRFENGGNYYWVTIDTRSPHKHPFPWTRFFKVTSFGPIAVTFSGLKWPPFENLKVTLKKLEHDHYSPRRCPTSLYSGIFSNHGDWIPTFCKS